MAVQTWKRSLSKTEYLYQTFQLSIRIGQIVMKLTRKNITARKRAIRKQKKDKIPKLSVMQSAQSWFSYARKYKSDKAKFDIAKKFSKKNNIKWNDTKILMRGGFPDGYS